MKKNKIIWVYIYIIAVGITASIIIIWITPFGSGVSPDSIVYIGGAKSLLSGKGFSINDIPITHFPPFYPLFLAVVGIFENNLVQASRLLNAIIFGVNAGMISLTVYLTTKRNFIASICAALFFLSSAPLLNVYAWAWSEPLFITLSLSSIILLSKYVLQPTKPLFIASSLLLGFALITRYVGIAFLPPALVLVFLGGRAQNIWQKCRDAFIWLILAIAPLGIWLIKNLLTSETATNRSLTYHPISLYDFGYSFYSVLNSFFAPVSLPAGIKLLILGLLTVTFIILLIVLYKRRKGVTNWRRMEIVMTISCLMFITSFMLFLFISISFFDAATPIDKRILSPVLAISIIGLFSGMLVVAETLREPVVRWGFLLVIILSISIKIPDAIHTALLIQRNGLGFTSRQWQESESIAFVKSIANNVNIYTNGSDILGFLTEKNALPIPRKTRSSTMLDNKNFSEEIRFMCENIIENRAILVYFYNVTWRWYLPSQIEIETTCQLPVLERFNDGIVYGKK